MNPDIPESLKASLQIIKTSKDAARLLKAFNLAIASQGKNAGKLKSKSPATMDAGIMWCALMLNANVHKVSYNNLSGAYLDADFAKECDDLAGSLDCRKLDQDRVSLERLGVW